MRNRKCKINSSTTRKKPQTRKTKANIKPCDGSDACYMSLPVLIEDEESKTPRGKRTRATKPLKSSETSAKKNNYKNAFKCKVRLSNLNISKYIAEKSKNKTKLKPETENKVLHTQEEIIIPDSPSKLENNSISKQKKGEKDENKNFGNSSCFGSLHTQNTQIILSKSVITYESIRSFYMKCEHNEKLNSKSYSDKEKEIVESEDNQLLADNSGNSLLFHLENESEFIDLDTITLVEDKPHITGNKRLKLKENKKNLTPDSSVKCESPQEGRDNPLTHSIICLNKYPHISLQDIVDWFLKNPQLDCVKDVNALKKGLCFSWLANNYFCHNQQCTFSHNAFIFFSNKLKKYPSKFIMILTVSMRKDELFADVVMAAFEVLSARQISTVWITFLAYFVFYVTKPSDCRFLKFWASAARFFGQLNKDFSAGSGFASLLSIFSESKKPEEWKIIEFVKFITNPPISIRVTYALLQPIFNMDIPPELLVNAVESCLKTQEDVLKVYLTIIPKLPIMTLSIHVIELLLKFSKTLETMGEKDYAQKLKQKLQPKVQTFKTKMLDFPLTALFQREISEELHNVPVTSLCDDKQESCDFNGENNYFEPKNNFYNLMIQAVGSSSNEIPRDFRKTIKPPTMVDIQNDSLELVPREEQIYKVREYLDDRQFDLLGKYLNQLREDAVLPVAEEFLKSLFQTKLYLGQVVNMVKLILFSCKTQNSAKVIGCVIKTLVLNLVRIKEWEKAYTLVSLCEEKQINILEGVVFVSDDLASVSQFRVALILVEIYAYRENYQRALHLIKKYYLYSSDSSHWKISWNEYDKTVRIEVLEMFLNLIISDHLTEMSFELFELIRKEQKDLVRPLDLRKFANQVLILLLNAGREEALNLFNNLKSQVELNETTIRAILVTLVRQNRLIAAKSLLLFYKLTTYILPEISSDFVVMNVSRFWLEEEIYIMFDTLFDLLAAREYRNIRSGDEKTAGSFEVLVNISEEKSTSAPDLSPLCLGLINPSFRHTCIRIERVLKNEFTPSVSILITPKNLKLNGYSLQLHLSDRIRNHLW